jgi:hypothetical protein
MTADTWLRTYLRDHGETPAKEIKAAGVTAGHNTRTLIRAMRRLDCTVRMEGRETSWSLPSITDRAPVTTGAAQPAPTSNDERPPTGPTCSHKWPVPRFPEPMPWWCPFDGTRYGTGPGS